MLENNQEKQIFYPKWWWRLLPLLVLVAYLFIYIKLCLAFWERRIDTITIIVMTMFLLCISFFVYRFVYKTRLIASPEGLQIDGIFVGKASWNEIIKISSNAYSPWTFAAGFRTWGLIYYSETKKRNKFLPLGHIIPRPPHESVEMLIVLMGIDWEKFKATEFGQILYQHTPQIFPEAER